MRRLLIGLGLVFLISLAATPVIAGKPKPFVFQATTHTTITTVLQQSDHPACYADDSCVVNPSECVWNIDDRVVAQAGGQATSASYSQCLYADTAYHLSGVIVTTPLPDLEVSLSFPDQNVSFDLPAVFDGTSWVHKGCVIGPVYQRNDPEVVTIPDSRGGWAVPSHVVITVAHTTHNGKQEGITARLEIGSSVPARQRTYCVGSLTSLTKINGAVWKWATN